MTTPSKKPWRALVTGATGIQGSHLIRKLAQSDDWEKIYAVSRGKPDYEHEKIQHLPINLQSAPIEVLGTLQSKGVRDVTHIFYTAFVETGDDVKNVDLNFGMFKTAVEAVERTGSHLQHVYLTTGGKWYGQHLPRNKTPYKEDDPRHFPPNFYYNQEDYLAQRVREGAKWTYNTLRPGPICGFSSGSFMNIVTSTALFGALSKELGLTHLRFPGTDAAYNFALDCVDVDLLTDAQIYLSTQPGTDEQSTANTGFNIHNGDVTRWKWIWPVVAKHFGLEVGEPQPLPLKDAMKDKGPVWERMQKKYGLREDATWDKLGTWDFAEFVYHQPNDWFANTNKLKRAGFTGMRLDTEAMWAAKLQQLSALRVIPSYGIGGSADKNVTVAGLLPPAESQQAGGATLQEEGDTAIVPTSDVKTLETPSTYSGNTGPESAGTGSEGTGEGSVASTGEKFNYTEATKAAAHNLAASAQAAKERAAALLHQTAGYAGSTAESAKETAAATQQRTAETAAAAQQKAVDTAAATQQAAVDAANATKQKAAEGYHAAADTAAQAAEAAQQKAAGVWESVKETVVHAKDTTAEYLGAKTQQAKETASDAAQSAQQKAAEATDAAKQKAAEAVDTTKQYAGAAQQKAAEGTEAAKQKAGEAADATKQYAGAAQQKAGETAQRAQESANRAGQQYTQAATETAQGVNNRSQGGGGGGNTTTGVGSGGQRYIPAAIERLDQSTEGTGGRLSTGPSGGTVSGGGGGGGQGYIPASTNRLDQSMAGTGSHLSTGSSGTTTHRVNLAGGPPGMRVPSSIGAMDQSTPGINSQGFGGFEYAPGVTGTGTKLTTSEADLARRQAAQDDPTAVSGRRPGALSAVGAELGLDGLKVERAPGGATTAARRQEE